MIIWNWNKVTVIVWPQQISKIDLAACSKSHTTWHSCFILIVVDTSDFKVLEAPIQCCLRTSSEINKKKLGSHNSVTEFQFQMMMLYLKNIAKGTTDPRVEFCLPKKQVLTQILIKFQNSKSFDQTLTSKSWPNIHFITSPSLSSKILTKLQFQKFRLNFNFKLLAKPCAQSLNKI